MSLNIESIRDYCMKKAGSTESFPFGESTLVFKASNKIFLLIGMDSPDSFNVKCDPEKAIILREKYIEVQPGYHMNKKHWNTVSITGRLTDTQLLEMIDHSYTLVASNSQKNSKRTDSNKKV